MNIVILTSSQITPEKRLEWIKLHSECFGCSDIKSMRIYDQKYSINESIFCLAYLNNKLAAAYNVIECKSDKYKFALSTDTMSNGLISSATVKLANKIYPYLQELGYDFVVGFPNKNIQKIREKKLGWKIISEFKFYILPSFLGEESSNTLYSINRKHNNFFSISNLLTPIISPRGNYKKKKYFSIFNLIGCCGVRPKYSLPLDIFINSNKNFGFVSLSGLNFPATFSIDINSIDVP